MISRVGRDSDGDGVRAAMDAWGLDTSALQQDEKRPTGRVAVAIDARGDARFEIRAEQAYDSIDPGPLIERFPDPPGGVLYHGTLAMREPAAVAALRAFEKAWSLPRFVDVNLRPPWDERTHVLGLLEGAAWIKLNEAEFEILDSAASGRLATRAERWRRRLGAARVLVTRGERGALLVGDGSPVEVEAPKPVAPLVDTVGAGDAFSAVALTGALCGWPAELTLSRASEFASSVCTMRGATAPDPALYERMLTSWGVT